MAEKEKTAEKFEQTWIFCPPKTFERIAERRVLNPERSKMNLIKIGAVDINWIVPCRT